MLSEFRVSARWNLEDPTEHLRQGARKVAELFSNKPHAEIQFADDARKVLLGNQLVQNVLAQKSDNDVQLAALHANAAGQQGVFAALVAVLDHAAGGSCLRDGLPLVTVEHVQTSRRLVDVSVSVRSMWREVQRTAPDSEDELLGGREGLNIAQPVGGAFAGLGFDGPAPTQVVPLQPAPLGPTGAPNGSEGHEPVAAWRGAAEAASLALEDDDPFGADAPSEMPKPVLFADLSDADVFDARGLGNDGAMLFSATKVGAVQTQAFKDREFMRRVLLGGRSRRSVVQLVDNYAKEVGSSKETGGGKRRRVNPSRSEVAAVLKAAFAQYPRLGSFQEPVGGGSGEVVLKAWSQSERNQILFHNELMQCCRVSLQEVSQRRARFHEDWPGRGHGSAGAGAAPAAVQILPAAAVEEGATPGTGELGEGGAAPASEHHAAAPGTAATSSLDEGGVSLAVAPRDAVPSAAAGSLEAARPASSTPPGGVQG